MQTLLSSPHCPWQKVQSVVVACLLVAVDEAFGPGYNAKFATVLGTWLNGVTTVTIESPNSRRRSLPLFITKDHPLLVGTDLQ